MVTSVHASLQLDLNGNKSEEHIHWYKKDHLDYLVIYNSSRSEVIYQVPLDTAGIGSFILDINLHDTDKNWKTLAIHFFTGVTGTSKKHGQSRWYFLSIPTITNSTQKDFMLSKGPFSQQYRELFSDGHIERNYTLLFDDIDGNGVDDAILTEAGQIKRVFRFHSDSGKWSQLPYAAF